MGGDKKGRMEEKEVMWRRILCVVRIEDGRKGKDDAGI